MKNEHYAGFVRRLIAFAIDCLVIGILAHIIDFVCTAALGLYFSEEAMMTNAVQADQALTFMLFFLYFIYFHGSTGRTPGKAVLALKLVQISGEPAGYGTAFLRWVGYLVSALFVFIGFIWIIFDGKKQGWHDKLAKTYVVSAKQQHSRGRSEFSYRDMNSL